MLSCSARQTKFGFAVRTDTVTLGRQIFCADGELFEKRTDAFGYRYFFAFFGDLRFDVPPSHVLPTACVKVARETAKQHPDGANGTKSRQNRASHKKRYDPENKIGIKQRMIERIHAVSAIHEAHDFFSEFH